MSIEKALADLTEALNANTAALLKAAGSAPAAAAAAEPAAEKKGPGRPKKDAAAAEPAAEKPAAPAKPTVTQEQMVAALEEVKDKISLDAAKKIISEVGGVDKRKDIPADKYAAVYEAAKAAIEGGEDGEDM